MGKQSAPAAPDPKDIYSVQSSENIVNSLINSSRENMDQITPDGILRYKQDGVDKVVDPLIGREVSIPHYVQSYSLHPQQQEIYNRKNMNNLLLSDLLTRRITDILPDNINTNTTQFSAIPHTQDNNLPERETISSDEEKKILYDYPTVENQQYEKALLDRLQPLLQKDREDLETKLYNQGVMPGSVSWNRAIDETNRKLNDARLSTILKTSEEQERVDNMQARRAYFHNLAQAQRAQQKIAQRQQAFHEILSLMQGITSPKISIPFKNPTPIVPIDYAGIAQDSYRNKLAEWKEQKKEFYDILNMGNQLAPLISDRRMKRDIKPVANLYQYRYVSDPANIQRIGVMAQEINKIRPYSVIENHQGIQSVDYGRLFNIAQIRRKNKKRSA
ncbi:tail fiber domain-containing protein [Candidatus Liberibacter africanus]|uniref:Peptidase S74 domain-containing protein n=1 Tax=Candidatus Liberibacter africanus PTSAPSY TaxID=1277257 RepID=A0A0G3I5F3_LIBAF|nr:tail fiber domain-containing protein [Candidatus Liberibacter africanus]AKK19693.1 hypothetical protein G293_00155 [Candidatus Liberibacter africanus PTSAPSY]